MTKDNNNIIQTIKPTEIYDWIKKNAGIGNPVKLGVDNNAYNKHGYHELYFVALENCAISSFRRDTGFYTNRDEDFEWQDSWENEYKGNFYVLTDSLPVNQTLPLKPEVYKKGDTVIILESAKECGDFGTWDETKIDMIGKTYQIDTVADKYTGISYNIEDYLFPHYCVKKIESEKPQTIQIGDDTYEVSNEFLESLKQLKKIN
jgi:hypothetical protein